MLSINACSDKKSNECLLCQVHLHYIFYSVTFKWSFKLGQGQSKCGFCLCFAFIHWIFFFFDCGYLFYFSFLIFVWFFVWNKILVHCLFMDLVQPLCLSLMSPEAFAHALPSLWLPTLLFRVTHLTNLFPRFPLKHHSQITCLICLHLYWITVLL